MENLNVKVVSKELIGDVIKLRLNGALKDVGAYKFKSELISLLKRENKNCIIDIRELDSMDIIGMNALAIAHRELEISGQSMTIVSKKSSQIDKVFALTKFDQVLNLQRA